MIKYFYLLMGVSLVWSTKAQKISPPFYDSVKVYAMRYDVQMLVDKKADLLMADPDGSFVLDKKATQVLFSLFDAKRKELELTQKANSRMTRYSLDSRAVFIFCGKREQYMVGFGNPGMISFDDSVYKCPVGFFKEICDSIPNLKKTMKL